jgi:phytol kinase
MSSWVACGAVITLLVVSMAALSAAVRRRGLGAEAARKLLHVEMGLATLAFPWLFATAEPVVLLAAVSIGWFRVLPASRWLDTRFGAVLAVERESGGEGWFACGVALAFLAAAHDRPTYAAAILVLALADSAAALAGARWGRARVLIGGARKSLAGSAAFCAIAFASVLAVLAAAGTAAPERMLAAAALTALTTTLVEALLGRGLDNLAIPVAAVVSIEYAAAAAMPALGLAGCATAFALAMVLRASRPCLP